MEVTGVPGVIPWPEGAIPEPLAPQGFADFGFREGPEPLVLQGLAKRALWH